VMGGPTVGVRKRVPQEVGESPDKNGHQHEYQLQRMPQGEGIRSGRDLTLYGLRHQRGQWLFDDLLKGPEDDESYRQTKKEQPTRRVPERTSGREPEEELQIGGERTNDQRRQNETGPPERKCGSSMSQCERHSTQLSSTLRPSGASPRLPMILGRHGAFVETRAARNEVP